MGDDISIDIRGLKPSETQVHARRTPDWAARRLSGRHRRRRGRRSTWRDSPLYATENTLVTYGSGATGLYGVDAVGGVLSTFQTLNPTQQSHGQLQYGFGEHGKQVFGAQATGTDEKIGYALAYGVSGTYGDFPGQIIAQTGLTGTNFTSSNLAGNTYFVQC